jgi:Zn-dependent protease
MPINPGEMRSPNIGWALSSLAGPASNILFASVVTLVVANIALPSDVLVHNFVLLLIQINVFLAVFNLLPVPPLDGFGVLYGLSPRPIKIALLPLMRYGPFILLLFLFLPMTQGYLDAFLQGGANIVYRYLGVLAGGI